MLQPKFRRFLLYLYIPAQFIIFKISGQYPRYRCFVTTDTKPGPAEFSSKALLDLFHS